MSIDVEVTLTNAGPNEVPVTIPAGAIFEADPPHAQNVAIVGEHRFTLPPRSRLTVVLTGRCLNRRRAEPHGVPGRLTPFRYAGPSFDQGAIWTATSTPRSTKVS